MNEYDLADAEAADLAASAALIGGIYRLCYAGPPWFEQSEQLDGFGPRLSAHLAVAGARGTAAWKGEQLVGVAYGWPAAEQLPDTPFYRNVQEAVAPPRRQLLRAPAFEVPELMVHPAHQGHGLGRALLNRLTAPHPSAWLCTHPDAPARALYERTGWVQIGVHTPVQDGTPFIVMSKTRPEKAKL
jgi:GNAT superfamily N-acetyltransferase